MLDDDITSPLICRIIEEFGGTINDNITNLNNSNTGNEKLIKFRISKNYFYPNEF